MQRLYEIVVLQHGQRVEEGTGAEGLTAPKDLYTQRLLASLPAPDPAAQADRRSLRSACGRWTPPGCA